MLLPWLSKCDRCGLAFASPQPNDDELATIYGDGYFQRFGFAESEQESYRAIKQATLEGYLQRVERRFGVGRLLDVGSAVGDMLIVGRRRGWESYGLERNRSACAISERLIPGATWLGRLEEYASCEAQFNLVCCTETLEHLRRPDLALSRMRALLRPGGGLALTVPDLSSPLARIQGPRWLHFHSEHLWYFNPKTLCKLARYAGFEVLECTRARKVFNLRYVLGVLSASPQNLWLAQAASAALGRLPRRALAAKWPPLPTGIWLLARKPLREGALELRPLPLPNIPRQVPCESEISR